MFVGEIEGYVYLMEIIIMLYASGIYFVFAVANDIAFELGFIIDFSQGEPYFYSYWKVFLIISFNNLDVWSQSSSPQYGF